MDSGSNHYFPVLRLKRGELWALRYLASDARGSVTPIIEVLPKDLNGSRSNPDGDLDTCVDVIGADLWTAWGGRPFILDTRHIGEPSIESRVLARFAEYAANNGLLLAPATGLQTSLAKLSGVHRVITTVRRGCCIRLSRGDLDAANTDAAISELLARLEVSASSVDLIVDLGVSNGFPPFDYIRENVPRLTEWRSFTVLSGAFPKDLQRADLRQPGVHRIPRLDWRHWASELTRSRNEARMPSFGDYTVQYAMYVEPPSNSNPSASIRYTSDAEWILMRGQGIKNDDSAGSQQWPANALLLSEMDEFCGSAFSAGDGYIAEHAGAYAQPGNPTTWIQAAINHHLAFTARQISGLRPQLSSSRELLR